MAGWLFFYMIDMKRLFRTSCSDIKSKGKDTLCRVEESISLKNRSAVKVINDIFNPDERLEKQIEDLGRKIDRLTLLHHDLINCSTDLWQTNYDTTRGVNGGGGSINC